MTTTLGPIMTLTKIGRGARIKMDYFCINAIGYMAVEYYEVFNVTKQEVMPGEFETLDNAKAYIKSLNGTYII